MRHRTLVLAAAGLAAAAAAVGVAVAAADDSDARTFSAHVTNPWFPLRPGTRWVYTGVKDGKRSRDVVTATHATRTIHGARCIAVADRLYLAGKLEERTTDWYSQDDAGNVWYFGEDTAELDAQRPRDEHRGHVARGAARREGRAVHAGAPARRPVGAAGVLEGPRRGSLPRRLRARPQRGADAGVDAARAGRARPQALRARGRHRRRADRARRRRARTSSCR